MGREETCPFCGYDLHCCLNCRFYDENAHNKCREPAAEWVPDKEKRNFCEYFEFRESVKKPVQIEDKERVRAKFEALFKRRP
ncbi:MAG: hypothetical protein HY998_01045 [candidate division NC10 bacterium]|nr:hypothetical protein [candidate division NC10 bacterium]